MSLDFLRYSNYIKKQSHTNTLQMLKYLVIFLAISNLPLKAQTPWKYRSTADAVWTQVDEFSGTLHLVKGANGESDTENILTSCRENMIPTIESDYVIQTDNAESVGGRYKGVKFCKVDGLYLPISEFYTEVGYMFDAIRLGNWHDGNFVTHIMIHLYIVETRDDLPEPVAAWLKPLEEDLTVTFEAGGSVIPIDSEAFKFYDPHVDVSVGTEKTSSLIYSFTLQGNYPNPVSDVTNIEFDLPSAAEIQFMVTDLLGREVLSLSPKRFDAGSGRTIKLNTKELPVGLYHYTLRADLEDGLVQRTKPFLVVR